VCAQGRRKKERECAREGGEGLRERLREVVCVRDGERVCVSERERVCVRDCERGEKATSHRD
jgi:hypothetical protein